MSRQAVSVAVVELDQERWKREVKMKMGLALVSEVDNTN